MIANASARRLEILVGPDQQDWSAAWDSLEIGYDSISEDGLIQITGSLTFKNIIGLPESLDAGENPSRFKPGTPVRIRVRNSANTAWITPFFNRMILLDEPNPNRLPRNTFGSISITLQLGCKLAWADTFDLDNEESGVILGTHETCDRVAARLLEASEINSSEIDLNTWPYSISTPFGKEGERSFTLQAGKLAQANDWRYLYQNTAGDITQDILAFTPSAAIATITMGQNDIEWSPLSDPEQPTETTKYAGVGYDTAAQSNPATQTITVTDDFDNYDPSAGGSGTVHRTTITKSYGDGNPIGPPVTAPYKREITEIDELEHTIYQNPTILQLVDYQRRDIQWTYEAGLNDPTQARLVLYTEELQQNERSLIADGIANNMRTIYEKTISITHHPTNEYITQLVETERQAEIILYPESSSPWTLQITRRTDTAYTEIGSGEYDSLEKLSEAQILQNSNLDPSTQNLWALRITTTPGKNAPPATQFYDRGITPSEKHYEGEASYTHRGGSTGRNRKRLYTVSAGFGFSNAQMQGLAEKQRDLAIGRYLGDYIEMAINDSLLTAPPLPEIHVVDGSDLYKYLGDALTFEFTARRATVSCAGIWLEGGYS